MRNTPSNKFLATREVVQYLDESGKLPRPISPANFNYLLRFRAIRPDRVLGSNSLFGPATVRRITEEALTMQLARAAVRAPTKPRKGQA